MKFTMISAFACYLFVVASGEDCKGLAGGEGDMCDSAHTSPLCCPAGLACTWDCVYMYCQANCRVKEASGSCANTRDNGRGKTCVTQLKAGSSCQKFLAWKDCDRQCNLCACSTASGTKREHCSGHGTCEATCTQYTCTGAKCKCDSGWSGDQCQNRA